MNIQTEQNKLSIMQVQFMLINKAQELKQQLTDSEKTIDELNSIGSEIDRKEFLIEMLEQEKKGLV